MKERPILFSAPMVRALLDGSKTQTRRIVKMKQSEWCKEHRSELWSPNEIAEWRLQDGRWFGLQGWYTLAYADCPYGQVGDLLWVREAWAKADKMIHECETDPPRTIAYRANLAAKNFDPVFECDTTNWGWDVLKWKPSIHMPHWASRINLEITNVRVERLNNISVSDCYDEGIDIPEFPDLRSTPCCQYRDLWQSINGSGTWELNPWVWVIEFKRVAA